jgi:serine/threonine-protein kinase
MQSRVLNGRYELLSPLGQGGMATVYRGRDLRLGRPVAIKLLHNYYAADDEFLQRFAHEAMSAAHLSSHPNIVDVYDVGKDGDSNYIVMELIEGQDLKALIEAEAPLPPEEALTIAAQVADGLEYAHRRGLVHRDVKPQNMLMTPDGQIRIADFGIAKSHLSTAVTQAGITFGTADYISPEQAQGLAATPQSDIYSLGVVLYEMLTGHLPYTGDTPMAVAIQHIQNPPPAPRQFNPSIPPALEALVLRAIAKNPQQRPASAKAFAQELRDYLAGRYQPAPVGPSPDALYNQPTMPYQAGAALGGQAAARPQPVPPRQPPGRPAPSSDPQQRRPVQQRPPAPRNYPAPPLSSAPARERSGFGFGTLLLGLLLLSGILALAWFALNTDLGDLFSFSPTDPANPTVTTQTAQAEPSASAAPSATPLPQIPLPSFIGRPEVEVVAELDRLKLIRRADPNNPALQPRNDPAPIGTIIEQDPPAGTLVPEGAEVTIVVSLGPEVVAVPDVTQQRFDAAQATLQQAGFVVARQDAPSQTVQTGFVISQNPQAGGRIGKGETVTLTVSAGDVVAFPDVVANGTLLPQAQQQIEAAGFNVVAIDTQGPDRLGGQFSRFQANEVVSATAGGIPIDAPGKLVPRGAEVVIAVRAP